MARSGKRLLIYFAVFILLFFAISTVLGAFDLKNAVKIEYQAAQADRFQIFYCTPSVSDHYTEENSVEAAILADGTINVTEIELPEDVLMQSMRLDIGDIPDNVVSIWKIQIWAGYHLYEYKTMDITNLIKDTEGTALRNAELVEENENFIKFVTTNNDGSLEIFPEKLEKSSLTLFETTNLIRFAIGIVLAALLTRIIYKVVYLRDLFEIVSGLVKNRHIIFNMAKNDFKSRYAGSYFGILWAFVQPLCTILIYWFVFEVGLRASSPIDIPYSLWLMGGLVPWFFFSEAWFGMSSVFLDYSYLVKKVMFELDTMPFIRIFSALATHVVFFIIMAAVYSAYGYFISLWSFQILYYVFSLCCLLTAISFISASIMVFIRDVGQIINIIMQFGMWLTPILWDVNIFPGSFEAYFKLNPMYYIVQGYRDCMLANTFILLNDVKWTIYFWLLTAVLLCVGATIFRKLKVHFPDVL